MASSSPARRVGASALIAVALGGCGGSSQSQKQYGTQIGRDYVRIARAFAKRPETVPTVDGAVGNFDFWIAGKAHGKDIRQDVIAAGFASDPAPSKPLSPAARQAAAAVVIPYIEHASSPKYGPLAGGYVIEFRDQKLEFRCKAPGRPPSDICNGGAWSNWQTGFYGVS